MINSLIHSENSLSGSLIIFLSEARFEVIKLWRSPAFAIPTLVFPWAFYLLFGVVLNRGGQVALYLLPAYATFGIIGPALFGFGVGVANEREAGWLKLKQASPMPGWTYIAAKILMSMVFALLVCLGLFLLSSLIAGIRLQALQWLSLLFIFILGTIPFCAMGLSIGFKVKGPAAVAVVNLIYLPMAVLSGLWFPLTMFPAVMQKIAWLLPPYHLVQLAFKVINMDAGHPAWLHLLILLGFTLLFSWLALLAFRHGDQRRA